MPTKRSSRFAPRTRSANAGGDLERLEVRAFDVLSDGVELVDRTAGDHQRQVVVRRPRRVAQAGAERGLEAAAHRQAAPVGVVAHLQLRLHVVLLGADRVGDERVAAVGSDDHPSELGDGLAALAVAANADDATVFHDEALHREPLTNFCSRLGGGVDEQLVQRGPPGCVGDRRLIRPRRSGDRERSKVERVRVDGRASGRDDGVEQSPALERGHPRGMDEMRGDRVARERRAVDQQDPVAPTGEQHRRRRSGAARPDDDRVICLAHGSSVGGLRFPARR